MKDQITQAFQAAAAEVSDYLRVRAEDLGESVNSFRVVYPCGFATLRIKPARGPLIKTLKEMKLGHSSEYGGWIVSVPHSTQSMDAKTAGIEVLRDNLKKIPGSDKYTFAIETRLD